MFVVVAKYFHLVHSEIILMQWIHFLSKLCHSMPFKIAAGTWHLNNPLPRLFSAVSNVYMVLFINHYEAPLGIACVWDGLRWHTVH